MKRENLIGPVCLTLCALFVALFVWAGWATESTETRTCVEVVAQPYHDSWYWVIDDQGKAWDRSYSCHRVYRPGDMMVVVVKTDRWGNQQRYLP